jgi:hypothetical protein
LSAAKVAVNAARDAEHPAWIGAARFAYTVALPVEAAGIASRVAARSLTNMQAVAGDSTDARQMLGQLHLAAGFTATVGSSSWPASCGRTRCGWRTGTRRTG